jgi:hypothetical protein
VLAAASIPLALTLIETIAGRSKAASIAEEIDIAQWDARHDSAAFRFTRPFALTVMSNVVAFWNVRRTVSSSHLALTRSRSRWSPMPGREPIGHMQSRSAPHRRQQ